MGRDKDIRMDRFAPFSGDTDVAPKKIQFFLTIF